jgi:predicted anti-sigma-YlaC factor YlaD
MILHKIKHLFGQSLTCEETNQIIIDYLEGDLPPRQKALFEEHITTCLCCGPYLDQYRTIIEMVKESGEEVPDPPVELVESTMAFLNDHLDEF